MDRPIAAFDIETIPDPAAGRRLLGLSGTDAEVVAAMVERRRLETDGRSDYPELPLHRIVTIGVAWLDPGTGRFKLGTCGADTTDERTMLDAFFDVFRRAREAPRIVSWNGNGFDLPVIRYRAMMHGLAAPELHRTDGEWRWNNYQNRYHDMHVDLMDTVGGYGASKWISLDLLSQAMGLPGKRFVEEPVYAHVLRGEHALVRDYCKLDVVHTLLLYLVWEVHRGRLSHEALRHHLATICQALGGEAYEGWRDVCAVLATWPEWRPEAEVLFDAAAGA
jgi:hypothetical protein